MDPEIMSRLQERFQYSAWQGRNRLAENLFIWKFFFFGDEVPNWSATRMEHTEVDDQPKIVQSLWETTSTSLSSPTQPAGLLNVRSIECKSRGEAHKFLLGFLGEFEGPLIYRWDETELGDVTFTVPGHDVILFARANLIHLVRNAGQLREPVTEVATALDQVLTQKPEAVEQPKRGKRAGLSAMAPRIAKLETPVKEARVGESVPLDLEVAPFEKEMPGAHSLAMRAAAEPVQRVQFRIFSPAGEIHEEGGRLYYTPQQPGLQDVDVFALNAARVATKKNLQLEARD